jgi:hypothetical protein
MPYKPIEIEVQLDGQDDFTALADQRDAAAWEAAPENNPERVQSVTSTRYIAWHAAKRAGQVTCSFSEFNNKLCISATLAEEEADTGPLE